MFTTDYDDILAHEAALEARFQIVGQMGSPGNNMPSDGWE